MTFSHIAIRSAGKGYALRESKSPIRAVAGLGHLL